MVIDRRENNPKFHEDVAAIFKQRFKKDATVHYIGGTLDGDEQTSDMGDLFNKMLGCPRVKFFTDLYRSPTVFWFTMVKE